METVNGNGSRPLRPRSRPPLPRSLRLLIGAIATLVIAAALVVPVVLNEGGSGGKTCVRTLLYQEHRYAARQVGQVVQALAIGVGVTRGCGASPSNVDIRSVAGVKPTDAVALAGDQSYIYVRRGVCAASSLQGLMDCLHRRAG
jgi:hypothetical protein